MFGLHWLELLIILPMIALTWGQSGFPRSAQ